MDRQPLSRRSAVLRKRTEGTEPKPSGKSGMQSVPSSVDSGEGIFRRSHAEARSAESRRARLRFPDDFRPIGSFFTRKVPLKEKNRIFAQDDRLPPDAGTPIQGPRRSGTADRKRQNRHAEHRIPHSGRPHAHPFHDVLDVHAQPTVPGVMFRCAKIRSGF